MYNKLSFLSTKRLLFEEKGRKEGSWIDYPLISYTIAFMEIKGKRGQLPFRINEDGGKSVLARPKHKIITYS